MTADDITPQVDPQLQAMFRNMVLPTMKMMSTQELIAIREFMLSELDAELVSRQEQVARASVIAQIEAKQAKS